MATKQDNRLNPAWSCDQLDSNDSSAIKAAYFDSDLHAWVLSRHADLVAAFQDFTLIPGRRDLADFSRESEEETRFKAREEVRDALCPARMHAWREQLLAQSDALCRQLPVEEPVDLMDAYARPLCLDFAALVTGISQQEARRLEGLAQIVSAATADPDDPDLHEQAKDASRTLRTHFGVGPESLRDSGFVAISQSLVRIVSAAWFALIQSPDQWVQLHSFPQSIDQAIEELLRYAGIIQTLWRTATEDTNLNGVAIRKGDQLLLRVFAGSHDPARFEDPGKLDCSRRDRHHFVFGAGGHACVAANLNRMVVVAITIPLLTRFVSAQFVRPVEWHGGSVMRSPASLWVVLS
jgi:cytochrome P450